MRGQFSGLAWVWLFNLRGVVSLPLCNTLWIGPALGPVERACLRSLMRQGHHVRLYAYDPVEGAPDGVEFADAGEILPRERIVRYASGSYALFANQFRYELQALQMGLWVDTDVYCVRPIDFGGGYVFGWQEEGRICNAVLRLPARSQILARLRGLFDTGSVPPWLPPKDAAMAREQLQSDGRIRWEELAWGLTGPKALGWLAEDLGVADRAKPERVFYPKRPLEADWVFDPSVAVETVITPATRTVHLWNELIKHRKDEPPPPGSFMARLHHEGA